LKDTLTTARTDKAAGTREVSRDVFHRGGFEVLQYVGRGHRSGMDAMLLGASLPENASGTVADLGAASGAAGLAALNVHPALRLVMVEIRPELTSLATQTLNLPANNHFVGRVEILTADATLSGSKRKEAGLEPNTFDYVVINPPTISQACAPRPIPCAPKPM